MFTLNELRLMKQGLNRLGETPEVKALRLKLTEMITDRVALQHLIETGRYPSWYQNKVRS